MTTLPRTSPNSQAAQWVGYTDIVDWLREISAIRMVHVWMSPQLIVIDNFVSVEAWVISLQQRAADGKLHYCRIPVLPIVSPIMERQTEDQAMAYLCQMIRSLREGHLDLVPGSHDVPAGVQLVEACYPFLDLDPVANRFAPERSPRPVRTCRVCGCTDNRACPGGCYWVASDLCSACEAKGAGK